MAAEILSELKDAKSSGGVWWSDLISIPLEKLKEATLSSGNRIPILYKGKPFHPAISGEKVVFNSKAKYFTPTIKIGGGDTYELVKLVQDEIVIPMIKTHIDLGKKKNVKTDIARYILETDSITVKYLVSEDVYNQMKDNSQAAIIKAVEFTNKAKVLGDDLQFLELKVYPDTHLIELTKQGHLESTLTAESLDDVKSFNATFPKGALIHGNINVSLFINNTYISLMTTIGKKVISDRRLVTHGFSMEEVERLTGYKIPSE